MEKSTFILLLLIIITLLYLFSPLEGFREGFQNECSIYSGNYNDCYAHGCKVMLDLNGTAHCIKNYFEDDS